MTNDDEVENGSLSSFLLAVLCHHFYLPMIGNNTGPKWPGVDPKWIKQNSGYVYLSAIAIPPTKKKNEKFLIQMFPNVPNDVIGVWHLLLIFFFSNLLLRLSKVMQMWNIMCPKRQIQYKYNAIGTFMVASSCATSNHFPKQICWKVFEIKDLIN